MMTDFDEFAARYVQDLLRTAYLIVWDEGDAEDLVQECLLKVARRWPRVRTMEFPMAYARRILINLANDGARGRARRRAELETCPQVREAIIDEFDWQPDRAQVLDALAELPVRQRAVLVLRYFNDLTEAQAAEVLGCPVGTVKSSAARGLATLREALQLFPLQTGSVEP